MRTSLASLILAVVPALAAASGMARGANPEFIEGKYIIQLKPGTSPEAVTTHHNTVRSLLRRRDGSAGSLDRTFQIGDNFSAYSGRFDNATIAAIQGLDEVLAVERDQVVRVAWAGEEEEEEEKEEDTSTAFLPQSWWPWRPRRSLTTQTRSTWSLGDLSHRSAGSTEYVYDRTAGAGTTAYVIDTGIRLSHAEFEGRASFGYSVLTGSTEPVGDDYDTEVGHGTHVAGIIAGKRFGVAKKAKVIDVTIMGSGGGSIEAVLAGIAWAVNDIKSKGTESKSVLNLSLTSPKSQALDNAVLAAYNEGILSVAGAGNSNKPVRGISPGSLPQAFTVGMTQRDRARGQLREGLEGSNYGPELDVFAPGLDIASASARADDGVSTKTGTSMSTALVSGLVCYLRGLEGGLGTPDMVTGRILELAIPDAVADPKGSPNLLVNNGSGR
ncbi:hypothetical protein KVR01_010373 [Diaporthe batatas]|uniref:uncharacterized protein n=1 Tax=Diaporthe batatas TaxID=748121 RepID=UPI001D03DEC0|nr:uncharacterized protein KVR01_010373 [Diaporthe batatas]KAG8159736.1 hypothetical protein KVR01_010373 [Diaporthe batatas]